MDRPDDLGNRIWDFTQNILSWNPAYEVANVCPECEHTLDTDATECPTCSANDHLGDGEETYDS